MSSFVVQHDTPLPPRFAWDRLTDWPAHGRFVPLTTVTVDTPGPTRVGTTFTAWTGVGRARFADPMEVVVWEPPQDGAAGFCRLEKRGRVMLGWAQFRVEAFGPGSRATWEEDAVPAHLPAFAAGASTLAGRALFGHVLRGLLSR